MAGIYIHIPFCKQACHYCDFHFSTSLRYRDEIVQAIKSEVAMQKIYLNGESIDTIYFGGGTPSLLTVAEINSLLDTIGKHHFVSASAEITLEANPDDLDQQKVRDLKQTAINRFSIGIQSFFDEDLAWMNRAHRSNEAESSVKRAQDAGFENITLDLIYGYPLLTHTKWKQNMEKVFSLQVPHVSAYSMTVEPKTPLSAFIRKKESPPLNDQQSAEQFIMLMDAMAANGFEHYEISNFALPGQYSKHNSNYWKGIKYLGMGPSAHSYNGETRQWNVANNARYLEEITQEKLPAEVEVLTQTDRLNEYIMTSLRTMWGLDLDHLNYIASGAADEIKKDMEVFIEKDWLVQQDRKLFLTRQGKLYADHIASQLFL